MSNEKLPQAVHPAGELPKVVDGLADGPVVIDTPAFAGAGSTPVRCGSSGMRMLR
jgi:hypothetical protein